MRKNSHDPLPEAFVSSTAQSGAVSRALAQGRLRKLASRLYTTNLSAPAQEIVRRNLWPIVAGYFPGALIADRTAFELQPAADGSVCVVVDSRSEQVLPGVIIRPRPGVGPLPEDQPFLQGLHLSSQARAYLENMRAARARRGRLPRTLGRREIEARLETLISRSGDAEVNRLRDAIARLAPRLGLEEEAAALTALIGALLGTRQAALHTPTGKARQAGLPYDAPRLILFQKLHAALRDQAPVTRRAQPRSPAQQSVLAFFEAYFSNFIEGTRFALAEAEAIVFEGKVPRHRLADAHDVLGTYRLAVAPSDWNPATASASDFIPRLQSCHAVLMGSRPEQNPGRFKTAANQAGAALFVEPDLVEGTLRQGYALLRSLETPFHRAVFTMFLIAEVHPFADGNGRTARLLMNAELSAAGEERIIIPTVYRNNYIAALKALTYNGQPLPLIRVLDFAWRWTAAIDWRDVPATAAQLESCHAFVEEDDASIRLQLPSLE